MRDGSDRIFGKYDVLRRLAIGGMGEIFLARQTGLVDRLVILKSLLATLSSDAQALAQFLDEARILGSVSHPNVVALYDVGEWEGTWYIAMEFIPGVDVHQLLRDADERKRRLPPLVTAQIIRDAALGLDAAHVATNADGAPLRIVHRDVSPHNLMLRQDGLTKLVDFGVAFAEYRSHRTEGGMLKGKLGYMAPEQIKGAPVEARADQFSLGVTAWEMLTQRRLFTGDAPVQVFMKIVRQAIPPPSSLISDVPPALDAVVARMTAQDPAQRFARLQDAAQALRDVLDAQRAKDSVAADYLRDSLGPAIAARLKDLVANAPLPARSPSLGGVAIDRIFCTRCGAQGAPGDRFCRACGNAMTLTPSSPTPTPLPDALARGDRPPTLPPLPPLQDGDPTRETRRPPRAPSTTIRAEENDATPAAAMARSKSGSLVGIAALAQANADDAKPVERAAVAVHVQVARAGVFDDAPDDVAEPCTAELLQLGRSFAGFASGPAANGRVVVEFRGDGATGRAVSYARMLPRIAARIGRDVVLRAGIASLGPAQAAPSSALTSTAGQLRDHAPAGTVWLSDDARARVASASIRRSTSLRGGADAMPAHELALPRRLVGRNSEFLALDRVVQDAARGQAGQTLLIGEGGSGKSALLELGATLAEERGFIVARARPAGLGRPLALDVVRQLIWEVLRGVQEGPAPHERSTLLATLGKLGLLDADVLRVRALLDDNADAEGLAALAPARRTPLWHGALLALFDNIAARRGLLLLVDDVHLADRNSLDVLAAVGARLGDKRIAVLGAARPVSGERALPLARRVVIPPLSSSDTLTLIAQLIDPGGATALPEPMRSQLPQRAAGNPWLATLLVRHLVAIRAIEVKQGAVHIAPDLAPLRLPDDNAALLAANHQALPASVRAVLQAAACEGATVRVDRLSRAMHEVPDVAAAVQVLVAAGIVQGARAGAAAAFSCTSEREGVVAGLDAATARRLHARWSNRLCADVDASFDLELAERAVLHLDVDSAQADAMALRVAVRADALGLFDVAAEHRQRVLHRGLRAIASSPSLSQEHASSLLQLARDTTWSRAQVDAAAAVDVIVPALKAIPPLLAVLARVDALRERGAVLVRLKRHADAEACFDEAIETLQLQPDIARTALLYADRGGVLEARGDFEQARTHLLEAARLVEALEPAQRVRGAAIFLQAARIELRLRNPLRARDMLGLALDEARRTHDVPVEADVLGLLGGVAQSLSVMEEAQHAVEAATSIAARLGDPLLEARLRQQLARVQTALGRRSDAATTLQVALSLARRAQWDEGVASVQQLLAVLG